MRWLLGSVAALAIGCGGHNNSSNPDAPVGPGFDGSDYDAPSAGGTTIQVTLTNRPDQAAMFSFVVAYQDGSGPWQLAGAPSGDTYTFDVNSPSWAVAWTCNAVVNGQNGALSLRNVTEAHFAVAERTMLTMDVPPRCTDRDPPLVALSGTVNNRSGGFYVVNFGDRSAIVGQQGTYRILTPAGTHDLVLRHLQFSGSTNDYTVAETAIDRGVAVTADTAHDLDASIAVATQAFNVDVTPPQNGRAQATTLLYSAGGTQATMARVGQNYQSIALDPAQAAAGDVYDQQILVAAAGQTAIVTNATATPGDQTFTAPDPLGGATSTVPATAPYPQILTTWAPYANIVGYTWTAAQQPSLPDCGGTTPCLITWSALLSPGVTGNSPGYRMPDLSALTGWDPAVAFVAGTQIAGYAEADTSSAGASDFPAATPPAVGTQRVMVRSDFTVTP